MRMDVHAADEVERMRMGVHAKITHRLAHFDAAGDHSGDDEQRTVTGTFARPICRTGPSTSATWGRGASRRTGAPRVARSTGAASARTPATGTAYRRHEHGSFGDSDTGGDGAEKEGQVGTGGMAQGGAAR